LAHLLRSVITVEESEAEGISIVHRTVVKKGESADEITPHPWTLTMSVVSPAGKSQQVRSPTETGEMDQATESGKSHTPATMCFLVV
jgi:hypothetical protein